MSYGHAKQILLYHAFLPPKQGRLRVSSQYDLKRLYVPYTGGYFPIVSTILVFVRFQPRSGWTVEHRESGATFEDVDLAEKEWADYDERSQEAVGITDLEFQFVKVK